MLRGASCSSSVMRIFHPMQILRFVITHGFRIAFKGPSSGVGIMAPEAWEFPGPRKPRKTTAG